LVAPQRQAVVLFVRSFSRAPAEAFTALAMIRVRVRVRVTVRAS
jgi:hypothetical protein